MDLVNSKEGFMNEYAGILDAGVDLSETDFDVLLLYLSRDSGSIAYDGKVSYLCFITRMRNRVKR